MAVTQLLSDAGHAAPVFVTAYDVHSFDRQSRHPLRSAAWELVGKPVTVLLAARVPASADPQPSGGSPARSQERVGCIRLLDGAGHTEALRPAVGHPAEGKRSVRRSHRAVDPAARLVKLELVTKATAWHSARRAGAPDPPRRCLSGSSSPATRPPASAAANSSLSCSREGANHDGSGVPP